MVGAHAAPYEVLAEPGAGPTDPDEVPAEPGAGPADPDEVPAEPGTGPADPDEVPAELPDGPDVAPVEPPSLLVSFGVAAPGAAMRAATRAAKTGVQTLALLMCAKLADAESGRQHLLVTER